jgi:hypothetical protein
MADFGMDKRTYGWVSGLPSLSSIFACAAGGVVIDAIGSDRGMYI